MSVVRQVILSPKRLSQFAQLAEGAIQAAIERAKVRITAAALAETPIWTGRLLGSFQIASTPRSVVFKWDAVSDDGFAYAKVVDEGRVGGTVLTPKTRRAMAFPVPWKGGEMVFRKKTIQGGFPARYYSEKVHQQAVAILLEELANELAAIGG